MKALFETPNAETDAVIHILPFQITEYSGKADIDTYFVVCKENDLLESTFRGRKLLGKTVALPEGYQGCVYQRDRIPSKQDKIADRVEEERIEEYFKTSAIFKEFNIWEHDAVPSTLTEPILKAVQYIQLADLIHQ